MICALILAAGRSERMRTPKQLLTLHGRTLLQHVIDAAEAGGLEQKIVVLGHQADLVESSLAPSEGTRVVRVADGGPQSASLKAGISAVGDSVRAVAVLLGDQPTIPPGVISQTILAFEGSSLPFARPFYGSVPGHPVIIDRSVFSELEQIEGDTGASDLLDPRRVTRISVGGTPPIDVDSPPDLQRLLELPPG